MTVEKLLAFALNLALTLTWLALLNSKKSRLFTADKIKYNNSKVTFHDLVRAREELMPMLKQLSAAVCLSK